MKRYFFIIEYLPHYADCTLLASRCLAVMHGFSFANEEIKGTIGTVFPAWSEQTIGNAIGFVSSSEKSLIGLSFQPYFTAMKEAGMFAISDIKLVPEHIEEIRVVRNSTIEKSFLYSKKKRLARILKRAEARGESHVPINRETRKIEHYHAIEMFSGSTQKRMTIYLQKQMAETSQVSKFNSYGFATNQEYQGTVPNLTLFDYR